MKYLRNLQRKSSRYKQFVYDAISSMKYSTYEKHCLVISLGSIIDIETLILQDADNLDAIGAIGIGRTFSFGGAYKITMWIPDKPFDRQNFDESEKDPSIIHHFYSKLLKLKANMNTETAKKMADERHKFMKLFLQEFFDEWNGKK